jgi:hypothetical protein
MHSHMVHVPMGTHNAFGESRPNQPSQIAKQTLATIIVPTRKLAPLCLEIFCMEDGKTVTPLDVAELIFELTPLTSIAQKGGHHNGGGVAMGARLVEIGGEDHEQSLRFPPMRQGDAKFANRTRGVHIHSAPSDTGPSLLVWQV